MRADRDKPLSDEALEDKLTPEERKILEHHLVGSELLHIRDRVNAQIEERIREGEERIRNGTQSGMHPIRLVPSSPKLKARLLRGR